MSIAIATSMGKKKKKFIKRKTVWQMGVSLPKMIELKLTEVNLKGK